MVALEVPTFITSRAEDGAAISGAPTAPLAVDEEAVPSWVAQPVHGRWHGGPSRCTHTAGSTQEVAL